MRPDSRITFNKVGQFAAALAANLRFSSDIVFKIPTALATVGATVVRGLISHESLGRAMDPSGLVALRAKLPGLAPENIASALGVEAQAVSGVLAGKAVGNAPLLDRLDSAHAPQLESNIDVLAAHPDAHVAPLSDAFAARVRAPGARNP